MPETNTETIAKLLLQDRPNPVTELVYANDFQLFIAVMLSAQTTDKKVNQVTSTLFKKYINWGDLAVADLATLQSEIHAVNFHKGKAADC